MTESNVIEKNDNIKKKKIININSSIGDVLIYIFMIIPWIFGIALSNNFLNIALAIIIPPYAWVVTANWIIELINKSCTN